MQINAFIIQLFFLFFIILGLMMMILPLRVIIAHRPFYRHPVRQSKWIRFKWSLYVKIRIIGFIYVLVPIIVLSHMHFQAGFLTGRDNSTQNNTAISSQISGSIALHQKINDLVKIFLFRHTGLVVVTIADDKKEMNSFGRMNLSSNQPPRGDTIFEIGSITKVFSAALLANLIEQNKINLETPLRSLLPSVSKVIDDRANSITLKDLVTHTTGLSRMPVHWPGPCAIWRMMIAADSYRHFTNEDILATLGRAYLHHEPGAKYEYSNVGFGLLGMVLSQQMGMDFHNLVKSQIADPLGMSATGVYLDPGQDKLLATGYRSYFHIGPFYIAQLAENWVFPNCMAGAGGLHSNAKDMLQFLAVNMGRTESEISSSLQRSHQVLFCQGDTQIGMGWRHTPLPGSSATMIYIDGMTGGYAGFMGFTDDYRVGVVILSNSSRQVFDIGKLILKRIYQE